MAGLDRIRRIVAWLKEGYPTGVPDADYTPLIALLRRRLTDEEVKEIARQLVRDATGDPSARTWATEEAVAAAEALHRDPAHPTDVGVRVLGATGELPSEADIARVRERLARKGWPVDLGDGGA